MIWHDHIRIQFDVGTDLRGAFPFVLDNLADVVATHHALRNMPEQVGTVGGAYRHEIRPGLRVIVIGQPHRLAVVSSWVVWHGLLLFTFLSFMTHAPAFI
ncbi:MAG: hypothetical protein PPP56_03485 [Longimonas sp.]|uniref:hypothetical protein n=1 Tax=Longimonas sp. TaxID=2039626 RepID=UPI0033469518